MKILHSILSHWQSDEVDFLLQYHRDLDDSVEILLAYGGPKTEFDKITWQNKVFIDDQRLRGPTDQQNYACWMRAVTAWAKERGNPPKAVFFTETDHPMLRARYGQELLRILEESSCGFLGKWCSGREGSNSYFYLRHREDPVLRRTLREASGVDDSPIFEALATGMLFRWEVLQRVQAQAIDIPVFTEVVIPSMVRALGYRLGCFDQLSDFMRGVRYRPNFSAAEVKEGRSSKLWCCHPFKDKDSLKHVLIS